MNKILLIATLLIAHAASGQVGYRTVQETKPAKKVYDSTIIFISNGTGYDTASLIGQELYFAKRSPYVQSDFVSFSDTMDSRNFISEINTTLKYPKKKDPNEKISYASLSNSMIRKTVIKTNMYKPFYHITSEYGGSAYTPYSALEDKTFTIIGWETQKEERDYIKTKITLRDPEGEKLAWTIYSGIPRPYVYMKGYLEKLKQTWVNQTVYFGGNNNGSSDFYNPLDKKTVKFVQGSKWQCTEVTFLFDERLFGKLFLILRNDAQEEIAIQVNNTYSARGLTIENILTEKQYLAIKQKEKEEEEAKIAQQVADQAAYQKQLKTRRAEIVKQFGTTNGNLIADGIVKLGMTKDMCATAKGTAHKVILTQVGTDVLETWFYYYNDYTRTSMLEFKNGKLIQIAE